MRIDKTYSELWDLVNTHEDKTVQETAKMAINALQKLENENRKLNNEIGAYAGTVDALSEEFSMLTGRMKVLKSKMLNV